MNTSFNTLAAILAVTTAAFAAPALAQEASVDGFDRVVSSASRDAVRADAVAALRAGTLDRGEATRDRTAFVSAKSRAQVAAEATEALRLGVVGYGEGPAPVVTTAQAESIRTAGLAAQTEQVAAR